MRKSRTHFGPSPKALMTLAKHEDDLLALHYDGADEVRLAAHLITEGVDQALAREVADLVANY